MQYPHDTPCTTRTQQQANLDPSYTKQAQDVAGNQGETTNDPPDSHEDAQLPAMQSAYLTSALKTSGVSQF